LSHLTSQWFHIKKINLFFENKVKIEKEVVI